MYNTYLISFDPTKNNWELVRNRSQLHPSDRFIKVYEGAIIIRTIGDQQSIIKSLQVSGCQMFLVVPVSYPPLDGVLDTSNWQYLQRNIF